MTVWVMLIILHGSSTTTGMQVGPYPTKAACEYVRGIIAEATVGEWSVTETICVPRSKS